MMAAPVWILAGIGDRHHARDAVRIDGPVEGLAHCGSWPFHERVRVEELLPHRAEVHEVPRLAQVLLRRLDFRKRRRLFERAEQRMERLAWHEVDGAILHLDEDVRLELTIEPRELDVG